MSAEISALMTKARRSLVNARLTAGAGDFDFAASRAYYAMFYAAEALLLVRRQTFSKHAGVIAAFNREFVRSGELPGILAEALREAFEQRLIADYGAEEDFPAAKAQRLIDRAEAFLNAADEWLGRQSG